MRGSLAAILAIAFIACGADITETPRSEPMQSTPVAEWTFRDPELQRIATKLLREAERRGITEVPGTWNDTECLIALESALGASPAALTRVNVLTMKAASLDNSAWATTRAQAMADCETRRDAACQRVTDMLQRWHRHKLGLVTEHLSDERRMYLYGSREWERYFFELIRSTPDDAATWGWIISKYRAGEIRRQYGYVDSEAAYRYYLGITKQGGPREAADVFSVPGAEIRAE